MSSVANKEKSKVFETILSSPGMADKCKLVLQVSRQNVLLLGRLIEAGLLAKEMALDDEIIRALPKESVEEFKQLHEDILKKAELTEFYSRLKDL